MTGKAKNMAELKAEADAAGLQYAPKATKAQLTGIIAAYREREGEKAPTDDLRARAEAAGLTFGEDATTKDLTDALAEIAGAAVTPEGDFIPAQPGERRPILRFTDRGDWQDPFVDGDYLVIYSDQVSEATGAVREGDEAVYPDAA